MSEEIIFRFNTLEVMVRNQRYFLRYDAGAHAEAWREDEISSDEYEMLRSGKPGRYEVMLALQKRLIATGIDPSQSNWIPVGQVGE